MKHLVCHYCYILILCAFGGTTANAQDSSSAAASAPATAINLPSSAAPAPATPAPAAPVVMPPTDNAFYLMARVGVGSTIVQDAALSPLRYLGFAFLSGVEYRSIKEDRFFSISGDLQQGSLAPSIGNELNTGVISSTIILPCTALGWRVLNDEANALRIYVGGTLPSVIHLKIQTAFGNSAIAPDVYLGLGAFARVEKDFVLFGKGFRAASRLDLPLVGIAYRPSYSTTTRYPASGLSNPLSLASDIRGVSLAAFPILSFRNSLEYMLPNGNALALNYDWDFYSYTHFNKVQAARHGISLAVMFRL